MVFISYGSCDRQIAEELTHYLEEPGITSVTFRGNGQEALMEGINELYMCSEEGFEVGKWYYLVAFPTTLESGYTISLFNQDGLVHEVVRQTPVTIKRSVWGKLTNVDQIQ